MVNGTPRSEIQFLPIAMVAGAACWSVKGSNRETVLPWQGQAIVAPVISNPISNRVQTRSSNEEARVRYISRRRGDRAACGAGAAAKPVIGFLSSQFTDTFAPFPT
jgi:hypothetical protein